MQTRSAVLAVALCALASGCGPAGDAGDVPVTAVEPEHEGDTHRGTPSWSGGISAIAGLDLFLSDSLGLPHRHRFTVERREDHRVLHSYVVQDKTKVAVIVADDIEANGEIGWGMESYATCNPAEFAPADDDPEQAQIWTDQDGNRVPTTEIVSFRGAEHCNWETVTFLELRKYHFVRDTDGALTGLDGPDGLDGLDGLQSMYATGVELPADTVDTVDTVYRLDGQRLWPDGDGSAAYVGVPGGPFERWPGSREPIICL